MKAVNLLPSDQRSAPASPGGATKASASGDAFGAYLVLGALALAVVGLAAFVLAGNTIKDRKAELARVSAEASATEAKAAALAPYAEFATLATSRIATVTGLAQSRFDWERALGDLSRALPRNVHLKSIKGSVSSDSGGGGGQLRGAVQSPAIELSGCTDSQKSVAKLMSRLRAVRGVTRVSLSKSDKGGVRVAAPIASADTDTASVLCKGSPPEFDVVMFFERAALPAGAQPAPVTGAAQPGANGQPATGTPPAAPGTPAGSTGQSSTPPTNGAQPAPATQGVSAP